MSQQRPDTEAILRSLKDFQRSTVDYAFDRLWTADDQVKKFLVADEVGLGKTMVAKGVIGRTIEHLWDIEDRIDIVYVCSNRQIASQNLSRLNIFGGTELQHADRLTMLPTVMRDLRGSRVNFVSLTPDTSIRLKESTGRAPERVVLYWMLDRAFASPIRRARRWAKFFRCGSGLESFERQLGYLERSAIDDALCEALAAQLDGSIGARGGSLRDELEACAMEFNYLRGEPPEQVDQWRRELIGRLRQLVARVAVEQLEPDLVILDEFQRFKDLTDPDTESDEKDLADAIFEHEKARVLLLSATPYKMYTLPDEPEGDDHYEDFTRTVKFLAGEDRAHNVERDLRTMRESLLAGGDHTAAREARDRVEGELRRVMCRTERLASTPSRDGMLVEKPMPGAQLAADDLRSWRTFDTVARLVDHRDVFEYWRSSPYPLNLMDRGSYQVRTKFEAAAERNDPQLRELLTGGQGLLDWGEVNRYRQVDPGNAKLRGLRADVLDRGVWRLAWLPPALPYYELGGAYAVPESRTFTKRLVFSAWTVVPKAIAVMLSYEAERRAMEAAGLTSRLYDGRPIPAPLQFRVSSGRLGGMPVLAMVYPSVALARAGDPLEIARAAGPRIPFDRAALANEVRSRIGAALDKLPDPVGTGAPDQRWYWAAPFLLDGLAGMEEHADFLADMAFSAADDPDDSEGSGLQRHAEQARAISAQELGPRPSDLVEVLTAMAVGGPGVCALRALGRVVGGEITLEDYETRAAAYDIAQGLRSLFNKPEIAVLLRSDEGVYWRAVLEHCVDGCLQSVLDEYAHTLVESEGLQAVPAAQRAARISEVMSDALSMRSATNVIEQVAVSDGQIRLDAHRMSSHFAARFGRTQADDKAAQREETVRVAFNSPFRPFVLASTSVGQEGLDFHTYSHAVVHWNLPGNPVDLEQREGRVHRYKGHAVRKNVAAQFSSAAAESDCADPWAAVFVAAQAARSDGDSDIKPFWVLTGDASIERYVPAMPLSRELQQYRRLQRTVGAYRMVIGQPRQDDLIRYVGEDASWLQIDLMPPSVGMHHGASQPVASD